MISEYTVACKTASLRDAFLKKYGHLRPGTYEITSKRYDERHDLFANETTTLPLQTTQSTFSLTKTECDNLNQLLIDHQLDIVNADELLEYVKLAIAEREHVKFIFTRALSNALAMLVEWGSQNGISRDDLSYLEWNAIDKSLTHPIMDDPDRHYIAQADVARKNYSACHSFKLAHLISAPRDIYVATQNRSKPNFVGLHHTIGQPIFLDSNSATSIELQNKIVCIQNADPGFDWIFTKKPAALVTQFGGANSHMAIRCTELGLPAAIGCGEQIFERIINARTIEINCEQKIIRPLHGN
jgi:phosphohistidine swiveling domain-containing protein